MSLTNCKPTGGGLGTFNSDIIMNTSRFELNRANSGGGCYLDTKSAELVQLQFNSNRAAKGTFYSNFYTLPCLFIYF